ncbi:hypothetical protein EAG_09369 [Camponotus floridanus]|uniref:Uncharacterized protein n=1 Tax=Camponotus floridanus TaxID=104421 RepID=E2B0Q8_CAMFO|nr:hypothetical protein EAG_09369 [Camponotus floridanus]
MTSNHRNAISCDEIVRASSILNIKAQYLRSNCKFYTITQNTPKVSDERDGLLVGRNYARVLVGSHSDVKYNIPSESFCSSKNIFVDDSTYDALLRALTPATGTINFPFYAGYIEYFAYDLSATIAKKYIALLIIPTVGLTPMTHGVNCRSRNPLLLSVQWRTGKRLCRKGDFEGPFTPSSPYSGLRWFNYRLNRHDDKSQQLLNAENGVQLRKSGATLHDVLNDSRDKPKDNRSNDALIHEAKPISNLCKYNYPSLFAVELTSGLGVEIGRFLSDRFSEYRANEAGSSPGLCRYEDKGNIAVEWLGRGKLRDDDVGDTQDLNIPSRSMKRLH